MATVEHRSGGIARPAITRVAVGRAIAAGGAVVALAVLMTFAWMVWHQSAPTQSARSPAARPTVTGVVRIEGGPPTLTAAKSSDFHALRSGEVVVTGTTAAGTPVVWHFTTNRQGQFALSLPAGRYTVTAITYGPTTRPLSTQPHEKVTVTPGHTVNIRLTGHDQ